MLDYDLKVLEQVDDLFTEETNDRYCLCVVNGMTDMGKVVEYVSLGVRDVSTNDDNILEEFPVYYALKALMLELKRDGKDIGEIIERQIEEEKRHSDRKE